MYAAPETPLPYVQVARLPRSASFYSAIAQVLGLHFISGTSSSVVFGDKTSSPPTPVFEVKALADGACPPPSRILFSAPLPVVVSAFWDVAVRAKPDLQISGDDYCNCSTSPDDCKAKITDFDGNIMEVVYVNPPGYPPEHPGSTIRQTQSSTDEVSRILDWNLEVATSRRPRPSVSGSEAGRALTKRSATVVDDQEEEEDDDDEEEAPHPVARTVYRRSVTTSHITHSTTAESNDNGLSTGAVIGGVLGAVAAGAAIGGALTYTMMNRERDRAPRQEYDEYYYPPRRVSMPDPYPQNRPRFVEVERTVEKIRYPEGYAPMSSKYPPPSHMARYSQAGGPVCKTIDDLDDRASRHQSQMSVRTRPRGRSEVSASRRPLMIADHEFRSNVGSRVPDETRMLMGTERRSSAGTSPPTQLIVDDGQRSHAPSKHSVAPSKHTAVPSRAPPPSSRHSVAPSKHSRAPSRHSVAPSRQGETRTVVEDDRRSRATSRRPNHRPPEAETFVSARSERSASTVRPPPTVIPVGMPLGPPKPSGGSRIGYKPAGRVASASAVKIPGVKRSASRVSAREVPLPGSHVGSSRMPWEDDVQSLAPSDSISCAGSRRSRH